MKLPNHSKAVTEPNQNEAPPQTRFNFVIPNATVTIRDNGEPMPIDQALAIVFHVAGASPDCKVRFYLEVVE